MRMSRTSVTAAVMRMRGVTIAVRVDRADPYVENREMQLSRPCAWAARLGRWINFAGDLTVAAPDRHAPVSYCPAPHVNIEPSPCAIYCYTCE